MASPRIFLELPATKAMIVAALALAATVWALDAPLHLDAVSRIGLNPDIRSLSNLADRLIYPPSEHFNFDRNDPSRPVVFAIYTVIWSLFGDNPLAFRVANLLFHLLNSVLVYICARTLFVVAFSRPRDWLPFVAAAAFAIAPINVGTAIYTYALNDVLAMTFSLLTLLAFMRWRAKGGPLWGVATVLWLVAGIFTKQSVAVMPAVLLAVDYFVITGRAHAQLRRNAIAHVGMFAIVGGYLVWRMIYFGGIGDIEGTSYLWDRWEYLQLQPEAILRYIGLLLLPIATSIDHVFPKLKEGELLLRVVVPWVIIVGLLVSTWRVASRRSAFHGVVAFALIWFLFQLAPTSSIMPTVDGLVERRVYVPSMGFFLFIALFAGRLLDTAESREAPSSAQRWVGVIAVALLGIFLVVSIQRSYRFRDNVKMWTRISMLYPNSVRALSNLAAAQLGRKNYDEALPLLRRATQLQHHSFTSWYNMGDIYSRRDSRYYDVDRAIEAYRTTLAINPGYVTTFFRLARLLQMRGELDEARTFYLKSIEAGIEPVDSYNNLGLIEANQGNPDQARTYLRKALELAPGYERAKTNLRMLEEGGLAPVQAR